MTRIRRRWDDGQGGIVDQDEIVCDSAEEWREQPESHLLNWSVATLGDGMILAVASPPGLALGRMCAPGARHAG